MDLARRRRGSRADLHKIRNWLETTRKDLEKAETGMIGGKVFVQSTRSEDASTVDYRTCSLKTILTAFGGSDFLVSTTTLAIKDDPRSRR